MEAAVKVFFSSPRFAVAGASQDTAKYGYKVLAWYHAHSLPVTPINPRSPSITVSANTVNASSYDTVASPSALPSPTDTALSIITAPPITLKLLQEAKQAGIRAVWLQPGTMDQSVVDYCEKEFNGRWIGGMSGGGGSEGWCVLVDGEWGLEEAGKKWEKRKL